MICRAALLQTCSAALCLMGQHCVTCHRRCLMLCSTVTGGTALSDLEHCYLACTSSASYCKPTESRTLSQLHQAYKRSQSQHHHSAATFGQGQSCCAACLQVIMAAPVKHYSSKAVGDSAFHSRQQLLQALSWIQSACGSATVSWQLKAGLPLPWQQAICSQSVVVHRCNRWLSLCSSIM